MSNQQTGEWVSVAEYARRKGLKSRQLVYNWILKNQVKWREVDLNIKRKQIWYE